MKNFSYEIFPSSTIIEKINLIPKDKYISIACSQTKSIEHTIKLAIQLRKLGFKVQPHIPARHIRDRNHLQDTIQQLINNKISKILIIAGDSPQSLGLYKSSFEILNELQKYEFKNTLNGITIAGYPEGHPFISQRELMRSLERKQNLARKMKMPLQIVTQLCFDPMIILKWAESIRKNNIKLPIVLGVSSLSDPKKLFKYASKSKVGKSKEKIIGLKTYSPEKLIYTIYNKEERKKLNITGIHIYTFNEFPISDLLIKRP